MLATHKKFIVLLLIAIIAGLIVILFLVNQKKEPTITVSPDLVSSSSTTTIPSSTSSQTTSTPRFKTYRNTNFGFEFQYPTGWTFHENTFGSPFSKFNLVGASPEENSLPDPIDPSILINIVTSDFADRAVYGLKSSNITVGGISGKQYEYEYEGTQEIGVDIPFDQYNILLAAQKKYKDFFNQILASFKFLK